MPQQTKESDRIDPSKHSFEHILKLIANNGGLPGSPDFLCIGTKWKHNRKTRGQNPDEAETACTGVLKEKTESIISTAKEIETIFSKAAIGARTALRKPLWQLIDLLHCSQQRPKPNCYSEEYKRELHGKWHDYILDSMMKKAPEYIPVTPSRTTQPSRRPSVDSAYGSGSRAPPRVTTDSADMQQSPTRGSAQPAELEPKSEKVLPVSEDATKEEPPNDAREWFRVAANVVTLRKRRLGDRIFHDRFKGTRKSASIDTDLRRYLIKIITRIKEEDQPKKLYVVHEERSRLYKIGFVNYDPKKRVDGFNKANCICVQHDNLFYETVPIDHFGPEVEAIVHRALRGFRFELGTQKGCPATHKKGLDGRTEYFELKNFEQALRTIEWANQLMTYVYDHENDLSLRRRLVKHFSKQMGVCPCNYLDIDEINRFWEKKVQDLINEEEAVEVESTITQQAVPSRQLPLRAKTQVPIAKIVRRLTAPVGKLSLS